MKQDFSTTFELIGMIIALLYSKDYSASISNIAKTCQVPKEYVRKAIITLMNNPIVQECISVQEDVNDSDLSLTEEYNDNPHSMKERILNGEYDNTNLEIFFNVLSADETCIIPLNHLEYGAIKTYNESFFSQKSHALFETKNNVRLFSALEKTNHELISEAIENNYPISFHYKHESGIKKAKIIPKHMLTNTIDNWAYVIASDNNIYRLDYITNTCHIIKQKITPSDNTASDVNRYKYSWGAGFNTKEKVIHVKLRITPETKNIISKIEQDTEFRTATRKIYNDEKYYYYEDDILGVDEFLRWMRGYGSSIVILEPKALRDRIINRAQKTLDCYNAAKGWNIDDL